MILRVVKSLIRFLENNFNFSTLDTHTGKAIARGFNCWENTCVPKVKLYNIFNKKCNLDPDNS